MNKNRVIAEMAEQACPNLCDCGYCTLDEQPCNKTTCGVGEILETLYDKGYRKIDGTDYVSMEWHDEQVLHAEEELKHIEKRTAKNIADWLEFSAEHFGGAVQKELVLHAKSIRKNYGIEVKNEISSNKR